MNYLTVMSNAYMKTHNHNTFLMDSLPARNSLVDKKAAENNNKMPNNDKNQIQMVWSKYNFQTANNPESADGNLKNMSWTSNQVEKVERTAEDGDVKVEEEEVEAELPKEEETSPSHHARRPMNAFLIFCKKHRPIVREKYPNLENRSVTRILGEWWALLEDEDKAPYTQLAKEYKDAFLSANPNFKWYKLPAPPLRTLNVRPTSTQQKIPQSSPPHCPSIASEFTPGKLADESQLGSLTSLMNNNYSPKKIENNNNVEDKPQIENYENPIVKTSPPKPFKKRSFDCGDDSNMTNQDLMNKVVDKIFTDDSDGKDSTRKSGRQCKGKRYEQFMVEGRLLGNKRDTKLTSQQKFEIDADIFKFDTTNKECDTPNLNNTIKRLAERTNMKELLENPQQELAAEEEEEEEEEKETVIPEKKGSQPSDFNLNDRISRLPSLSYEVFHQRKRDSKKRKNRVKNPEDCKSNKIAKIVNKTQLVGSKKRKNKQTITHLEQKELTMNADLLALATLAEVAANTEKINDSAK